MDPRRYGRIKEVLQLVRGATGADRTRLLAAECEGDPALRSEVEELLLQYGQLEGFLDQPVFAGDSPALPSSPLHLPGYRILDVLGRGGMGVVYLARQEHPEREVALKLLCAGNSSAAARRRFEREIRALARLDHPAIASIHDAGEWSSGGDQHPWFTMEVVEGETLRQHAERASLDRRARVELLLEVCDGVAHAHEHGVLHRDLKPENLLVTEEGRVKVLDFGIARLTDESSAEPTFLTVTGQVLGTLAYMAPEQADGSLGPVDERCDVYALGVVLYELLTGRLPLETRGLLPHRALRTLVEEDPTPAGEVLSSLRGDLETVLGKALEKDPARRYASVRELAADLRRWLDDRPVLARPPTGIARTAKLVRRHRGLAAGLAAAFLALAGGLLWALAAEARASAARDSVLGLSAQRRLEQLHAEAQDLWPADSRHAEAMADWIATAEELLLALPTHERRLARLERDPVRALPEVSDEARDWHVAMQRELVEGLVAFAAPGGGLEELRERHRLAASCRQRTLSDAADAWREAARAIADAERLPLYGGLVLEPQEGLLPLGPDPRSGLWEFALADGTGAPPARDASGRLAIGEETGIVLVLVPGGAHRVGAQSSDPGAPLYHPDARGYLDATVEVELEPYLISKYEVTQGQWVRVMGSNPASWESGSIAEGQRVDLRNPVESVSWDECIEFCRRLGLQLPSEAQWELAARGGTSTSFPWGEDLAGLDRVAHFRRADAPERWSALPFAVHAPVGSLEPNPYGLHDVLGNVREWCRDGYESRMKEFPVRPGDGLRVTPEPEHRSHRGGCWLSPPTQLRAWFRTEAERTNRQATQGLRPVRRLVPSPSLVHDFPEKLAQSAGG